MHASHLLPHHCPRRYRCSERTQTATSIMRATMARCRRLLRWPQPPLSSASVARAQTWCGSASTARAAAAPSSRRARWPHRSRELAPRTLAPPPQPPRAPPAAASSREDRGSRVGARAPSPPRGRRRGGRRRTGGREGSFGSEGERGGREEEDW